VLSASQKLSVESFRKGKGMKGKLTRVILSSMDIRASFRFSKIQLLPTHDDKWHAQEEQCIKWFLNWLSSWWFAGAALWPSRAESRAITTPRSAPNHKLHTESWKPMVAVEVGGADQKRK
jgi:hypothetical protein